MNLLYLTICFPLISFLFLSIFRCGFFEKHSAIIGVSGIGLSTLTGIWILIDFLKNINYFNHDAVRFDQLLWVWMSIERFNVPVKLTLDGLSLVMLLLVTVIGFVIFLYSSWYMRKEDGYSRFFAYINLFIASMIILILADNLLVMYFGWEIVGLCSYMLIGFYYKKSKNGIAAIKSFVITRIGDVFLACSFYFLYYFYGTLNISDLENIFIFGHDVYNDGNMLPIVTLICLMLLCGATGKSAQVPLHTWLSDAMVGPTPVSALIHASTMVTAGVYLILRMRFVFEVVPNVLYFVSLVGVFTLVLSSFAALVQIDVKRLLAYSTMSQIGYMFFALGAKGWYAALFHLVIHAFFKALLFLAAGSLVMSCNNEKNILKMGGLYKSMPFIYICFLVGGASLSGMPILTSGFYSKEAILLSIYSNYFDNVFFIFISFFSSFITAMYSFRMIYLIFHGSNKIKVFNVYSFREFFSLSFLLVLSTCIGALIKNLLSLVFPFNCCVSITNALVIGCISSFLCFLGVFCAFLLCSEKYLLYLKNKLFVHAFYKYFFKLWLYGWRFDCFYNIIFVKPYLYIVKILSKDNIGRILEKVAIVMYRFGYFLSLSQNGKLSWYVISMGLGVVVMFKILILFYLVFYYFY